MARDHARIHVSIWDDADFKNLPATAQSMYFTLCSQPRLSYAGVLDYIPSRLTPLAADQTDAKVRAAVRVLEKARFVIVDRTTHELLIRTYIRHDGVLNRANMGKALGRAMGNVMSPALLDEIRRELVGLFYDDNQLAGWVGLRAQSPMEFAMASGIPLDQED